MKRLVTVGVYGIQSIILQRVMRNVVDFANVNLWVFRFLVTPCTAAFVFFVSVLIIRLIQRNTPLTFVLFGSSLVERKRQLPTENQVPDSDKEEEEVERIRA
jgi:hypothetical protein